jgi:flagellar biosynthesis GTPase FlhF
MTEIFKDIVQACPNIKAVVIHGEEPYKVIVKNGGAIPLELIVNKTHNVAHGCRLSNNAYYPSEWIIYTDVVAEAVAILLDQDAIPLVTTEDRNEILPEPTWNSTEEKAARKRKRKDGMTDVEKAEEEAQRVVKAADRDRKRAENEAEEEAQRVVKAAAKTAKHEEARKRKEEEDDRKKEQMEYARQRKREQEEQVPKARGKQKTFDDRMEDLKRFKETHGHANVSISEDKSLGQFCNKTRHTRKNPGNGKQLTAERIAALDALGFIWTTQEYVTRSFDEWIHDLREYKKTHGHVNVNRHEDSSLSRFCVDVRHSLKQAEKDGTRKLTEERIARLDDLGFKWTH